MPWSGEGVLGTDAGVAATIEVIKTLERLLRDRQSVLGVLDADLGGLRAAIASIRTAHGGTLPTNGQLTRMESERLNASIGQALTGLSRVPGALETTIPAQIPKDPLPGSGARPVKSVDRRAFLVRSTALLGTVGVASLAGAPPAAEGTEIAGAAATEPGAVPSGTALGAVQSFTGVHQAGILNPAPAQATFVAIDSFAPNRRALQEALQALSKRANELATGGSIPLLEVDAPPADSGILGPVNAPDGLTVTIGFGASLFDHRYGLAARRPAELTEMPTFPVDQLDQALTGGDVLLQICAQHRDTVVHTLRELLRTVRGTLQQRWTIDGFSSAARGPTAKSSPRNLFAFRDGTANPLTTDASLIDELVWAGTGEPSWAAGGTYQVVRIIRMQVEFGIESVCASRRT